MALPGPTIQRILREHLSGPGLVLPPGGERALFDELKARLGGLDRLEIRPSNATMQAIEVLVIDPRHDWAWSGMHLRLQRAANTGELELTESWRGRNPGTPVPSVDAFVALVHAVRDALARQQAMAQKREKVRGFQAQVIVAAVRKLADAEQFEFYAATDSRKLTLYVLLGGEEVLELEIPFAQHREILPELGPAIRALREARSRGVRFRIGTRPRRGQYQWTNVPDPK